MKRTVAHLVLLSMLLSSLLCGCDTSPLAPTSERLPAPPVHVALAALETVQSVAMAIGETRARRDAMLRAEAAGRVVSLEVEIGDEVTEGQVLARLDSQRTEHTVDLASAEVAQARARLRQASRQRRIAERLADSGGIATQEAANAGDAARVAAAIVRAAEARVAVAAQGLEEAVLRAPFAGVVTMRLAEEGELVGPGTPIVRIADAGGLVADVWLSPRAALDLHPGAEVRFSVHARPGEGFLGRVAQVGRVVDERTRRVAVRLELDDPNGRLVPGLLGRFEIALGPEREATTVPRRSVFERHGENLVYVVQGGQAERRPVVLGETHGPSIEVVDGLMAGETVVTDGIERVVRNRPVRVIEAMAQLGDEERAGARP